VSDTYSVIMGGVAHRVFLSAGNAERDAFARATEAALARSTESQPGRAVAVILRDNGTTQATKRVIALANVTTNTVTVDVGSWVKHSPKARR